MCMNEETDLLIQKKKILTAPNLICSQAMAVSCQTKRPFMSHFGETCTGLFSNTYWTVFWIYNVLVGPHNIFIYWCLLSLTSADQPKFRSSVEQGTGLVRLFVPGTGSTGGGGEELLVCQELWDMTAANVACKEDGQPLWEEIYLTFHNAHT